MSKSKLALLIDNLFCSIFIFAIIFVWVRRITKNAILSLIFSISISLTAFIVILYHSLKKHSQQNTNISNKKFIDECINFLVYTPKNTYINYIENLFSATHVNSYTFKTKTFYLYINLKHESTDIDFQNLVEIINKDNTENFKIFLITKSTSKSFEDLVQNSPYKLTPIPISSLKKLMEQKKFYPITSDNPKAKNKKQLLLKYKNKITNLSRKDFKNLFITGLSLLFISLITPYSFLYLLIGSVLLILSIISLLKKNISTPDSSQEFFESIKK